MLVADYYNNWFCKISSFDTIFFSTLPTKSEMENLPSFPRENLTLCDFLGSGAFGEVYEGTAKDILGPGTGTSKVAVKVLQTEVVESAKILIYI